MKKSPSAFANQLLLCVLVTFCTGGSIGLAAVWLRHQISVTAKSNRDLAAEVARLERLIDEQKTLLETEQAPDKLRGLNAALRLGLVPMSELPVQQVTENVIERMARRAGRGPLNEGAAPAASVTFRLARN
jgi:hypothetical protein